MIEPIPVRLPLLNANEPEAVLAAIHVHEGQQVTQGQPLCTLETTKSTAEVEAEAPGYIAGLRLEPGQTVRAGDLLCYLAETADWQPPQAESSAPTRPAGQAPVPEGLRISQPALELARQLGLDLGRLPVGPLVTESMVRAQAKQPAETADFALPATPFDPTAIIIYGGGGHGKMVIDLLRALGTYRIVGLVDDGRTPGERIMDIPVLGGSDLLPELRAQGVRLAINAVGGIGRPAVRIQVFRRLAEAGFACPAIVHPSAYVEPTAILEAGAHVMARAYVGSEARIGYGSIVNLGAIVAHDCVLGEYSAVSPGAILAGEVEIGPGALVGMGATVNLRVKVGAGAQVGNGATVKSDVPEKKIVRAGTIWPE